MIAQRKILDVLSTKHLDADLKGRSVRGGLLTVSSQGVQFVMQTASTVVLARLLTPADFGLVAMVTAVTGLAAAFADFGLSEATIQRKEITHNQVSALFWLNGAIGMGLTLVTTCLGPVLAWFYREPRLREIAFLLSLNFLLGGLRAQPYALLKRQMRYSALAICDISAFLVAVPIAIGLAWRGGGYWALVATPLTTNSIQLALSWLMVRWRPGMPRRDASIRPMIKFGGRVAVSYLICNLNRSADGALIGWYWGAGPLGLYSRALNLLILPLRQLSGPISSVAIPAFSRLQGDPERFARYYLRAARLIVWICAPLYAFLFAAAGPTIALVLGHQWRGAVPVFQFLAISILAELLFQMSLWVLISRGQSDRLLRLLLSISPALVVGYLVGLPQGITGVALCGSLALLALLPFILRFTFQDTFLSLSALGRIVVYPVFLSIAGIVSAKLALHFFAPERILVQLLVEALGFSAAYLLAALLPQVREEASCFKELLGAFGISKKPVWPTA